MIFIFYFIIILFPGFEICRLNRSSHIPSFSLFRPRPKCILSTLLPEAQKRFFSVARQKIVAIIVLKSSLETAGDSRGAKTHPNPILQSSLFTHCLQVFARSPPSISPIPSHLSISHSTVYRYRKCHLEEIPLRSRDLVLVQLLLLQEKRQRKYLRLTIQPPLR